MPISTGKTPSPRGFTLVEAVMTGAVIAIVSIMAIVAYNGYIREARRQNVESLAETAAAAANAYLRRTGSTAGLDASKLDIYFPNPAAYSITINNNDSTVTVTDNEHNISATRHF